MKKGMLALMMICAIAVTPVMGGEVLTVGGEVKTPWCGAPCGLLEGMEQELTCDYRTRRGNFYKSVRRVRPVRSKYPTLPVPRVREARRSLKRG